MLTTAISILVYGIGTVTSLAMTYIEGARRDKEWDVYRISGIILCFFWPLLLPVFIVTAFLSMYGRGKRHSASSKSISAEKTLVAPRISRRA